MVEQVGHKVFGTIKQVKGECDFGHKVGEKFELSCYSGEGLCGAFYHSIYPHVMMLQFGGKLPDEWGGDVIEVSCPDAANPVIIELSLGK